MDKNRVELCGNLGAAPKILEATADQGAIANFSVATNIRYLDKTTGKPVEKTEWHKVVCYDWCVDVARTLKQGSKVSLDGYLRSREYEAEHGKRTIVEIVARDIHEVKLPPRKEQGDLAPEPNASLKESAMVEEANYN